MSSGWRALGLLFLVVGALSACSGGGDVFTRTSGTATGVGNPDRPITHGVQELVDTICGVINRCNPQVYYADCEAAVLAVPINTQIGASTSYSTLNALDQAEQSGLVFANSSATSNCVTGINQLSCSDPSVVSAYNPASPQPYAGVSGIVPTQNADQCGEVFAPTAAHAGWNNIRALGPEVPALPATDLTPQPTSIILGWNPMTTSAGTVASYNVYRGTSPGGENFSSPVATGISPSSLNYTDTSVSAGTTYYYLVQPVVAGTPLPTSESDSEIKVVVPPNNMALVHRWIANQEICGLMGRAPDRNNNYRCAYTGPGNVGGYYDLSHSLLMDTYGQGCNYTPGPACGSANGCIGTAPPPSALGVDGNVYYDRSGGGCWIRAGGNWISQWGTLTNPQLIAMSSNQPGLPQINGTQGMAWNFCSALTIPGIPGNMRLPRRKEQVAAAAWDPSLSPAQIGALEGGMNLNVTHACNSNSASGLTFDNQALPSNLDTLPWAASTGFYGLRTGSVATSKCVSRYGVQDLIGNYWEYASDQLSSCNTTTHTCAGGSSTLDPANTDWSGYNFDGLTGPGGTGAGQVAPNWTDQISLANETYGSTDFIVPEGLPAVTIGNLDALAIGTSSGQFDPSHFQASTVYINSDASGSQTRSSLSGGSWALGGYGGRWDLNVIWPTTMSAGSASFRCVIQAD